MYKSKPGIRKDGYTPELGCSKSGYTSDVLARWATPLILRKPGISCQAWLHF